MNKLYFPLILSLLLVLIMTSGQKSGVDLEVRNVVDEVVRGGTAKFIVSITNEQEVRDVFRLTTGPADVGLISDFAKEILIEPNQIKLEPGEIKDIKVYISVLDYIEPNKEYVVNLYAKSINSLLQESVQLKTFVINNNDLLRISHEIPRLFIPGEKVMIKLRLVNRVDKKLDNLRVSLSSNLAGFSKDVQTSLNGKEEKTLDILVAVPDSTKPGDYALNIRVYDGDNFLGSSVAAFSVAKTENIEVKNEEEKQFLIHTKKISKKNNGNVALRQIIEEDAGFLKRIFLTMKPEGKIKDGKIIWDVTILPRDEFTVELVYDYRSLFYGILAIIVFIILAYILLDRSVTLKKRVFRVKGGYGEITGLKILLHLRNGSGNVMGHIRVVDLLPKIIEPTQDYGTLKPSSVQQGQNHLRLMWDIESMEPREERVITYKVKARLGISEECVMPASIMHYMVNGRAKTVKSARLIVRQK